MLTFSPEQRKQSFLERVRDFISQSPVTSLISSYFSPPELSFLFIDSLWKEFLQRNLNVSPATTLENFEVFVASQITANVIEEVETNTRGQSCKQLWGNIRFGRITASVVWECVKSHTWNGKHGLKTSC